ncbi:MAG: hypothetical protein J1E62_10630 [Lachnospiraceae bacterium]|nr:hypothetical protein [Lachnospiraceae bacterium]
MAICNSGNCGCGNRIVSNVVQNMPSGCMDVCVTPICGDPSVLSILAPLIYDEIGINLCATFTLGIDVSTTYPTAVNANVQVISMTYTYGDGNVQITPIVGRPNCYQVTLSNLTVNFAVNLYDSDCRLLGTIPVTAVYLPPATTDATYDEDTNPTSVTLEIFAPYGVSYSGTTAPLTPVLNQINFEAGNNVVTQGLNLYALPKALGLDITSDTITVGLTLILQSLYYAGYNVASGGKIQTPKGSIVSPENTDCMQFVAGDLLDLSIKPLELGPPNCGENLKNDCTPGVSCGDCPATTSTSSCSGTASNFGNECGCSNETTSNSGNSCGCGNNGSNNSSSTSRSGFGLGRFL